MIAWRRRPDNRARAPSLPGFGHVHVRPTAFARPRRLAYITVCAAIVRDTLDERCRRDDRRHGERVEGDSPRPNLPVLSLAALLLAGGAALIATAHGWRLGALYLVGGGLGLVLYHAAFGFTGAWRVFLRDGRGAGLRAQMLMLGLATVVILPLLADGDVIGRSVGGAVAPFGLAVGVGAFLFGIGMQLGGGCASGTLFTVGAGNARMAVTLAAFILGSVAATRHLPWWLETPSLGRLRCSMRSAWHRRSASSLR